MRFSFTIVLAVVAAFASSVSAMPTDAGTGFCPAFCRKNSDCSTDTEALDFLCEVAILTWSCGRDAVSYSRSNARFKRSS
ncbi:hypothetical protein F4604DRAFT_1795811 [Suillus subluteus]|nr:hypothetical protein F4604DRAFT_1795811 [Suillus subluteus]